MILASFIGWWKRAYFEHDWRFYDPKDGIKFTGYLERCEKCGEIVQIPQ